MTHSADLQWTIVRNNSKFLQKRGGLRMSNDPFNNTGKWTKRHSGVVADVAAVVKTKGEKVISVTIKDGAKFTNTAFEAGVKASKVAKAVSAARPDLKNVAFRRARHLAGLLKRQSKVKAARKEHSAKRTYKHKAVRAKKAASF